MKHKKKTHSCLAKQFTSGLTQEETGNKQDDKTALSLSEFNQLPTTISTGRLIIEKWQSKQDYNKQH